MCRTHFLVPGHITTPSTATLGAGLGIANSGGMSNGTGEGIGMAPLPPPLPPKLNFGYTRRGPGDAYVPISSASDIYTPVNPRGEFPQSLAVTADTRTLGSAVPSAGVTATPENGFYHHAASPASSPSPAYTTAARVPAYLAAAPEPVAPPSLHRSRHPRTESPSAESDFNEPSPSKAHPEDKLPHTEEPPSPAAPAFTNAVPDLPRSSRTPNGVPRNRPTVATRSSLSQTRGANNNNQLMVLGIGSIVAVVAAIAAVFLLGYGGQKQLTEVPEEVNTLCGDFIDKVKAKDIDGIWSMMSRQAQDRFNKEAQTVLENDKRVYKGDLMGLASYYGLTVNEIESFSGRLLLKKVILKEEPWIVLEHGASRPSMTITSNDRILVKLTTTNNNIPKLTVIREEGRWRLDLVPDWHY